MKLSYYPYEAQLRHAFTLSTSSRTVTPLMMVEIEHEGVVGYGEASMPPYLGESQQSVARFLQRLELERFSDPFRVEEILSYVDKVAPGNNAAKAAVDIALHDLVGKMMEQPWYRIWGLSPEATPYTSFTIGIDMEDKIIAKTREAEGFRLLKVKLGAENDRQIIQAIRSVSQVPLCVDVNQGWTDRGYALEMINFLREQGVVLVEQPMPVGLKDDVAWLSAHSPLPIIADEAFQRIDDLPSLQHLYAGINIKLMKSTGLREAKKMIDVARTLDMKVMLGCMTETSCAISAAAQLSPLVDWADLDGALLISNDLFDGMKVVDGKICLNNRPGIGVEKIVSRD